MPKPHVTCYLRQILESKGLTAQDLAVALDLDPATLSRIIKGRRNPRVTFGIRVARHLGVPITDLWPGGENSMKRRK